MKEKILRYRYVSDCAGDRCHDKMYLIFVEMNCRFIMDADRRERVIMKKWRKLTVVLAGIATCVGLIGSSAMVQAKEDSAKTALQTVSEQTGAELSAATVVKLENRVIDTTSDYKNIVYCPEKNGVYFIYIIKDMSGYGKGYKIDFYSLAMKSYKTVYVREQYDDIYVNDNGAFFVTTDKSRKTGDSGVERYSYNFVIDSYNFKTGGQKQLNLEAIELDKNLWNIISSFGVDDKGRYYIATNEYILYLFSPDGKLLSQTEYSGEIYEFTGFDKTNGNFYYRGTENWRYWGYDHSMASLKAGNVGKDNSLTVKNGNLMYLYQSYFFYHKMPVEMLNGRYLAALSIFSSDNCVLLDSNQYNINDVTESTTSINIINSGVSVSLINIANKKAIKMAFPTAATEYEGEDRKTDISSVGSRCAMNDAGTSLLVKTDARTLTEYDVNTKKEKINMQTTYPVYTFFMKGSKVVVIEKKDNDFYLETFNWVYPKTFRVTAPASMKVGTTGTVACTANSEFVLDYSYKSSDPNVVSIDSSGHLNAWKKGTATITVSTPQVNVKKTVTIKVTDSKLSKSGKIYKSTESVGAASATMHQSINSGYTYGNVQTAYLNAKSDGTFERVEYIRGYVVREIYDSSYRIKSQKKIKCELPLFGGYYNGEKYNYLVFGQSNTKESKTKEVIRVVKYDKNWKRIGACRIKGANTYMPFDAGGLSMTETAGKLYIHTCHTMFASSDGYHHQANCTFVVKESNMKLADSYYDVMNLSAGYVSHSFAQQIATDGTYIYRADLGDAYPRGIALTATEVSKKVGEPAMYGTIISIPGYAGNNYTGYTLNDLKLGDNNYILTGTGIKSEKTSVKNVYINAGSKTSLQKDASWITNYTAKDKITVMNPKLVKISGSQFLLLWEEKNTKKNTYTTKMVLLDEAGNKASAIYSSSLALAMCEPVVTKSGTVIWYVTNNDSPVFVEINPYQLSKVQTKARNVKTFKTDKTESFDNGQKSGYRKGDIYIKDKMIYKITSSKTVAFGGVTSNTITSLSIPKTVKIGKKTYQVTTIASRAFVNRKKLKKVTIGTNVTKIGSYAFYGCTNLKTITIKSTKLKASAVGSKAFTKIYTKATIKVPKGKKTVYKKFLLKKGITKKMKIK